jgi:hypothetical protein
LVFIIVIENSVYVKSSPIGRVKGYLGALQGNKGDTNQNHAAMVESFVDFLEKRVLKTLKIYQKTDIGLFLSTNRLKVP